MFLYRHQWQPSLVLLLWGLACLSAGCGRDGCRADEPAAAAWPIHARPNPHASAANRWLDVILEASARRVDRVGAQPTVISRETMMGCTAMFDAWACYDARAVGTRWGSALRRPPAERTLRNQETAIAYAVVRVLAELFPEDRGWLLEAAQRGGVDFDNRSTDPATPAGIGNLVANALIEYRRHDGANQLGDVAGGDGQPYADYTGYRPARQVGEQLDPDRWMPIPFRNSLDPTGPKIIVPALTPHWQHVKLIGLDRADQFRPPGPPKGDSEQMKREVAECVRANATLTIQQKAIVEFMRDGPRSTGQSGHWLRFAQDLSRRDNYDLDQDVKLFFAVGAVAFDAFIACWEAKYHYDSSRPYWYVRQFYKGQMLTGYAGPCQGFKILPAERWLPYSPETFITPPFPGYPSGHATVSGASSTILALFSGSDRFEFVAKRVAGQETEPGCTAFQMQALDGVPAANVDSTTDVVLSLPTFSATAELAAESRMLGGYHIRTDNEHGLAMGRQIARFVWPRYRAYWEGTASVRD